MTRIEKFEITELSHGKQRTNAFRNGERFSVQFAFSLTVTVVQRHHKYAYNLTKLTKAVANQVDKSKGHPSFYIYIYPKFFRIEHYVGEEKYESPQFLKDGPMKQLVEDIRNQVISPRFVPLLDAMNIKFYDGYLLVEVVQDFSSREKSASYPVINLQAHTLPKDRYIREPVEPPPLSHREPSESGASTIRRERVIVHLSPLTLEQDIQRLLSDPAHAALSGCLDTTVMLEKEILLLKHPPVCLDSDPAVGRVANWAMRKSKYIDESNKKEERKRKRRDQAERRLAKKARMSEGKENLENDYVLHSAITDDDLKASVEEEKRRKLVPILPRSAAEPPGTVNPENLVGAESSATGPVAAAGLPPPTLASTTSSLSPSKLLKLPTLCRLLLATKTASPCVGASVDSDHIVNPAPPIGRKAVPTEPAISTSLTTASQQSVQDIVQLQEVIRQWTDEELKRNYSAARRTEEQAKEGSDQSIQASLMMRLSSLEASRRRNLGESAQTAEGMSTGPMGAPSASSHHQRQEQQPQNLRPRPIQIQRDKDLAQEELRAQTLVAIQNGTQLIQSNPLWRYDSLPNLASFQHRSQPSPLVSQDSLGRIDNLTSSSTFAQQHTFRSPIAAQQQMRQLQGPAQGSFSQRQSPGSLQHLESLAQTTNIPHVQSNRLPQSRGQLPQPQAQSPSLPQRGVQPSPLLQQRSLAHLRASPASSPLSNEGSSPLLQQQSPAQLQSILHGSMLLQQRFQPSPLIPQRSASQLLPQPRSLLSQQQRQTVVQQQQARQLHTPAQSPIQSPLQLQHRPRSELQIGELSVPTQQTIHPQQAQILQQQNSQREEQSKRRLKDALNDLQVVSRRDYDSCVASCRSVQEVGNFVMGWLREHWGRQRGEALNILSQQAREARDRRG
ncbi:hypothetical protein BT69DRAFT_1277571 [Atractiella rhizophila]|nr:hypothetical protein BT69DRAFT_1277571 [Atractiella rhizophila]